MYEPLTPYKLPNNPENSDTFINKAVLPIQEPFTINIIESSSFTIYHLPSWNQTRKWVYFNTLFSCVPLIVFFYLYVHLFLEI